MTTMETVRVNAALRRRMLGTPILEVKTPDEAVRAITAEIVRRIERIQTTQASGVKPHASMRMGARIAELMELAQWLEAAECREPAEG